MPDYDIARDDTGYLLCLEGRPLATPGGRPMRHASQRPLEHLLRDLACCPDGTCGSPAHALLARLIDVVEPGLDPWPAGLAQALEADPLLARKRGAAAGQLPGLEDLEAASASFAFQFGGLAEVMQSLERLLMDALHVGLDWLAARPGDLVAWLGDVWAGLPPEVRAAAGMLSERHGAGVLLPLLLTRRAVTPSEYAAALAGFGCGCEHPATAFARLRADAATAMEVLQCLGDLAEHGPPVSVLIRAGEGADVEFKSTLCLNLHTGKKDPAVSHASLKTVAAFLNAGGGALLIGVRDDGSVEGVETDGFPNLDRFSLHFWAIAEAAFGQHALPFISARVEPVDGRSVFAVRVRPCTRPVFLAQKNAPDELYVRIGCKTLRLGVREALAYVADRFGPQALRETGAGLPGAGAGKDLSLPGA